LWRWRAYSIGKVSIAAVEKDFIVQRYLRFSLAPQREIHSRGAIRSPQMLIDRIDPPVGVLEAPDIVCSMTMPAVAPHPRRTTNTSVSSPVTARIDPSRMIIRKS
jgi:hypothetical protein